MMKRLLLSIFLCVLAYPIYAAQVGKCQVPQSLPNVVCKENGSEKFCLSTPKFGVTSDYIDLLGKVDLSQGLADLTISAQHIYTGSLQNITAKRCDSCKNIGDFCINNSGEFCAKIELPELGAYSARVSASFLDNVESSTVKFSKIVEPDVSKIKIESEPDPLSKEILSATHINLKISLLDDCEQCDFIGSSTGAITIKAENKISSEDGLSVTSCETNVEQGGSGKFSLGVPVGNGGNQITLKLCSPALESSCYTIKNISWGNSDIKTGVEIISPPPMPSYPEDKYSEIKLSFKWNNANNECVNYEYNLESEISQKEVCPVNGIYDIILNPRKGVNALVVRKGGDSPASWPWFFGWGEIESPFDEKSWVKEKILATSIPKDVITNLVIPKLNEYLKSDKFYEMISGFGDKSETNNAEDKNGEYLPNGCSSDSSSMEVKVAKGLTIGGVEVRNVVLEDNKLSFRVITDDVNIPVDVASNFGDLPLRIGWRKAAMDVILMNINNGNEKHLELSGPHSDCDYRKKPYCEDKPAILIPANLIGDGKWGQFVHCDEDRREISGKLKDLCHAIENINAQTGLIHDKVLQAINDLVRCSGSSMLNKEIELNLTDKIPPIVLSIPESIEIKSAGINIIPFGTIGAEKHFLGIPKEFHHPSVGVIKETAGEYTMDGLSLGVPVDSLNKLLFGFLAKQKDGLRFDIDENFIKEKFGFDFNLECDKSDSDQQQTKETDVSEEGQSAFCLIRPRVQEILGSSLSSYGYFEQKQPLLLRVTASTLLPPHVSLVDDNPNALDISVGGITIDFYPLTIDESRGVDEFGNLYALTDKDGKPVILDWASQGKDVPIISFGVGLLARIEILFDGNSVSLKLLGSGTKLFISSLSGSNATTVPDELLVDTIRGKLVAALDGYTAEDAKPILNKDIGEGYNLPDPLLGWYIEWKDSELKFKNGWIELNNLKLKNE